jgi:hypothetical protein
LSDSKMKLLQSTGATAMFSDNDINFDMQLESWDINSDALNNHDVQ